jgi:short-subunit dehydrogenase
VEDHLPYTRPAMNVIGARVLLTGASGGIGQALARRFASRGAALVLTGRRAEVLEPLARELGALAIVCDLADPQELAGLVERAGTIDVLVANAALPATGHLTELSPEQIDRMLEVNLRAPIQLARALAPGMIERRRGHLVFISSLSGKAASPLSSMYNATKFGLRGFALALREDLAPAGVGVSVVLPGFISDAGMFADAAVRLPPGVGTRTPDQVARATIDAVQRNRAEVEVAPLALRLGANLATVAPALAARTVRLTGGDRIARQLAAGQTDKRPSP